MTSDERRQRAVQWIEIIDHEVTELVIDDHMFWEMQAIIRRNPQLERARNHFYIWMGSLFARTAALSVRRQAENNRDSVSMRRFLEELKAYPDLISREYHVSLYLHHSPQFAARLANATYDNLVGNGAQRLDPSQIETEISEVVCASDNIKHYVDRIVAHYDPKGLEKPTPTFDDVTSCIKLLERLVLRYLVLATGKSKLQLLPTFQYEWKDIFRFPWIEDTSGIGL